MGLCTSVRCVYYTASFKLTVSMFIVYNQREKEGFKKSSRPSTAGAGVDRNQAITYINEGNQTTSRPSSRPNTAGGNNVNFSGNNNNYNQSYLAATNGGNFHAADFYNQTGQRPGSARVTHTGTNAHARPQTAGQLPYRGATPLCSGYDFNPEPAYDEKAHSRPATGLVPPYVTLDKQVTRFYAHFFEDRNWDKEGPLGDPGMEKEICRPVTIQYYLYDNDVQILEPRVTNAGKFGTFSRAIFLYSS